MKISEIQAVFAKAAQLLGDAEVKLSHVEGEAETELKGLEVLITSADTLEAGTVTLLHGPVTPPVTVAPVPAA